MDLDQPAPEPGSGCLRHDPACPAQVPQGLVLLARTTFLADYEQGVRIKNRPFQGLDRTGQLGQDVPRQRLFVLTMHASSLPGESLQPLAPPFQKQGDKPRFARSRRDRIIQTCQGGQGQAVLTDVEHVLVCQQGMSARDNATFQILEARPLIAYYQLHLTLCRRPLSHPSLLIITDRIVAAG